jgi:CRISPR-associated protein (TIGR02584 family)
LTPQIVTETLYCLLVQRRPPVDVRAIHILTTQVGREKVLATLLARPDGWFHRLCRDYRIARGQIRFNASCIHVFRGADGRSLEDVRTPGDNARVADAILTRVRDLTGDPNIALHASAAGGRKTMGLLLGAAFQLFARPQDRLSHVLVSPPELESHPDFFYPPIAPMSVTVKDREISTTEARLDLAEIPVLLLRDKLQPMGLERLSYTDLIARSQEDLDRLIAPPALRLSSSEASLQVGNQRIRLTAVEYGVYRLLAEQRRKCQRPQCAGCEVCAFEAHDFHRSEVQARLAECLDALKPHDQRARELTGWRDTADKRFREVRARIKAKIRNALGPGQWADRYYIARAGNRPDTRYYLPLPPELIHLE